MRVQNAPASFDDLEAYLAQSSIGPGVFDASEGDDIELWGYFHADWRGDAETWLSLELGPHDVSIDAALAGYTLAYSLDALSTALDGVPSLGRASDLRLIGASPLVVTIRHVDESIATLALGDDPRFSMPVWACPVPQLLREVRAYLRWALPFLDAASALAPSTGLSLHRLHFSTYLDWLNTAITLVDGD